MSGVVTCNFQDINFKYYSKCDDGHVEYFYYGLNYMEKNDLSLFLSLAKHSTTILDIGANTGLFSVLSSISNKNAGIHAIEPYESNANRLIKNVELNLCKNISIHRVAMGEKEGEIQFVFPADGRISEVSSVNENFSSQVYKELTWVNRNVSITTLDNFRKKNNLRIDLIKCDVETHEIAVFEGAKQTIREDRPTILFECYFSDDAKTYFDNLLLENNYFMYLPVENGLVHLREGLVPNLDGLNYLITPVKPLRSFISYKELNNLWKEVLCRH